MSETKLVLDVENPEAALLRVNIFDTDDIRWACVEIGLHDEPVYRGELEVAVLMLGDVGLPVHLHIDQVDDLPAHDANGKPS